MAIQSMESSKAALESRSGLDPWNLAELPPPPDTRGLRMLGVIGPGAIVLGSSIGSGEWLLGPAAFVKYGLALLWVTGVASFLQTLLNTEVMRYTLYTGEPVFTGFMRTRPRSTFWAWFYSALYFLQVGWPAWAGAAAGGIFYAWTGRLASEADAASIYWLGVAGFMACVLILLLGGRRIERTLEILNWILIVAILGGLLILCLIYGTPESWWGALVGFTAFDARTGRFEWIPEGADWFLLGAFAAYSGCGGVVNLTLSNWARDKGFGMGQVVGYIPAAGAKKVKLAHTGSVFRVTPSALSGWKGWWRIIQVDQWGVFFVGALLGMALPAILYTSVLRPGTDMRGLGIAAELAAGMARRGGTLLTFTIALMGAWVLFKTQLDLVEGSVRAITDILWTGSRRIRRWKGGDVRVVYYLVLALLVLWALVALRLSQPIILLQLGANVAGITFVVSALHVLRINSTLLPPALRPSWWRRIGLVLLALFYGFFVYLWLAGGLLPDRERGFLFTLPRYFSLY